jgi:hypothetical protein
MQNLASPMHCDFLCPLKNTAGEQKNKNFFFIVQLADGTIGRVSAATLVHPIQIKSLLD